MNNDENATCKHTCGNPNCRANNTNTTIDTPTTNIIALKCLPWQPILLKHPHTHAHVFLEGDLTCEFGIGVADLAIPGVRHHTDQGEVTDWAWNVLPPWDRAGVIECEAIDQRMFLVHRFECLHRP